MDIVTTSNFHATLLPGLVSVVFVPAERIRHGSWPLLNLLLYSGCSFDENEGGCVRSEGHVCRSMQTEIFSIVSDREGATLFMDPSGVDMFKHAGMEDLITVAPQSWRAIQIHLGPMVAEFPGVVSFLSKLLADDHISILNMSTYDTDVIFVQEQHLEAAISCLQLKLSRGLHGLKEEAENALSDRELTSPTEGAEEAGALVSASRVGDGQYLTVYPESLVLVRLQKDALRASAYGLTQLVLLSTGSASGEGEPLGETGQMSFWCCCETAEEVSLIMDERCLPSFEDDSLIVSPDRWRAIKLSGRAYGFDETGVVAAMSGCSTETQVLNVSCFGSNVAFVLDDMLDDAIETLRSSLDISRVER
ncbi:GATS protein-like 3 [Phytophthora pseudosyringae]|uniref:GATS protein-like 3 n=1 Tax=Phytophthora pseudosyringae TaxID=221518 RepID=A0A8T1WFI3_9STRA|nr:GATS protein-like 3 [Phytophthora pseudosyringae]